MARKNKGGKKANAQEVKDKTNDAAGSPMTGEHSQPEIHQPAGCAIQEPPAAPANDAEQAADDADQVAKDADLAAASVASGSRDTADSSTGSKSDEETVTWES